MERSSKDQKTKRREVPAPQGIIFSPLMDPRSISELRADVRAAAPAMFSPTPHPRASPRRAAQPAETITDLFSVLPSAQCRSQPSLVTLGRCSGSFCSVALPCPGALQPVLAGLLAPFPLHLPRTSAVGPSPSTSPRPSRSQRTAARSSLNSRGFFFRH